MPTQTILFWQNIPSFVINSCSLVLVHALGLFGERGVLGCNAGRGGGLVTCGKLT